MSESELVSSSQSVRHEGEVNHAWVAELTRMIDEDRRADGTPLQTYLNRFAKHTERLVYMMGLR